MSNITSDLSGYVSYNPTDTYEVRTTTGEIMNAVGITIVLNDGLLIALDPPNEAPRRYVPYSAIVGITVTGTMEYNDPPPEEPPEE